ncbi:hypothetical protein EHT25_26295 [Larkinella rosea]|uniref:DUF6896 domain-containing protein n=2 Tax=Larkinella rosea TaxID=2025312 RepID=A0A3P1BG93_9BACT|nr:hypothetical protein [Larkinella rosea]RRB00137.1 hypothetical protein EHT25_26295 [Larkinella rosea]
MHSKGFQAKSRTGFLDLNGKIPYFFHGKGCTITVDGGISLSIDFDVKGRCDGFTTHILESYLYFNRSLESKFSSINDFAKIQALLKELEKDGFVLSKEYYLLGPMYVLPNDFFADQPLSWVQ